MLYLPFSLAEKVGARLNRLIPANRKPNRENRLRQKTAQSGADGFRKNRPLMSARKTSHPVRKAGFFGSVSQMARATVS